MTGTSGKTTITRMIGKILEEAGYKTAVLSSIEIKIGEKIEENKMKMTMPGRMAIQKFLRQAVENSCQYAVLEVTSEGIKQHRHRFIKFDVAVLSNLSPEHIEAHKGFENYKKAKGRLFKSTKSIHILNLDDKNAQYFLSFSAKKKYGFRIKNKNKFKGIKIIEAKDISLLEKGVSFKINDYLFEIPLLGEFNVYNILAAITVGISQGIDLEAIREALRKVKGVPGRMEIVVNQPFKAVVDYAHTPTALKNVYQTIKGFGNAGKMICVLGACGGGRDKWKRPVLGKIAAENCQKVIITNEDPYDDDPWEIIEQVSQGAEDAGLKPEKLLDRKEAIKKALLSANPGDVVVITGKGSEPWMCLEGGRKVPWDDRRIVRDIVKELSAGNNNSPNLFNI